MGAYYKWWKKKFLWQMASCFKEFTGSRGLDSESLPTSFGKSSLLLFNKSGILHGNLTVFIPFISPASFAHSRIFKFGLNLLVI